jgi:hypothetical protein
VGWPLSIQACRLRREEMGNRKFIIGLLQRKDEPRPPGEPAFRLLVPCSELQSDLEVAELTGGKHSSRLASPPPLSNYWE